ncbi:collagen-like protein [Aquimarina mytili]|uniref:Collagen-like protein n=1 Tax=Aquimarina mytili TaxID=874423 RepID=A0A936ZTR5_9FLAO|nr:collagen-like protein [Aquimarina mytili]MBL0684543.1 collagen-like protein [Aquimarina mytili]
MDFFLKVTAVLITLLFMFSCEGEDGAIGPQGEQGLQGEQGSQGDQGAQGETGTANVIYSDWTDSSFPADIMDSSDFFVIDAPEITDEIRNSGAVLVYGRTASLNNIIELPVILSGNKFYNTTLGISAGQLNIFVQTLDGSNVGSTSFGSYRYIIIPGGTAASKNASLEDYKAMSYQEIITLFNIPE